MYVSLLLLLLLLLFLLLLLSLLLLLLLNQANKNITYIFTTLKFNSLFHDPQVNIDVTKIFTGYTYNTTVIVQQLLCYYAQYNCIIERY